MHKTIFSNTPFRLGMRRFMQKKCHTIYSSALHEKKRRHHPERVDVCAKNYDKVKIISIIDDLR